MVLSALLRRRAVRAFASAPVSDDAVREILTAAQLAPTSHNNRSVEFVVVRDQAIKQSLFTLLGQEFLLQAPVLVIPVTPIAASASPVQDLSLASMAIFVQATELGLGTVWKNVSEKSIGGVREILGIPATHLLVNIIPIGVAADQPTPYTGVEFSAAKLHADRW